MQTDLLRSFLVRWRGPGALIKGVTWLNGDELLQATGTPSLDTRVALSGCRRSW
jgi:hypothetical protein